MYLGEQGTGIMVQVRMPSGKEATYFGGMVSGVVSIQDVDTAIAWLACIRETLQEEKPHDA